MSQLIDLLNTFGHWLIEHLWKMSIELAIFAAVVAAVIYLLRVRSPAIRHWFWCLVLAKPVVTFLIASPLSLYWFLVPPRVEPPPAPPPAVRYVPVERPAMPIPVLRRPAMVERPAMPELPPPRPSLNGYGTVGLVWALVAGALGLRLVVGCAYVSFLRQTATRQQDGPLASAVEQASGALGMRRRVALALSDVAHGPVLAGVLRPVILLPRGLAEEMSAEQIRLITVHELAHVKRFDNLLLLLQRFAEMFFFFHPVVWLCGWIMRREAEAACDDVVLSAQIDVAAGSAAAYADSLTRVAEMRASLTRRLLVNTLAAAESDLSRRVRRILKGSVGRTTFGLSVASVIALVLIASIGLPAAGKRRPKPAKKKEETMADQSFEYGFRHDPMKFVENDATLEGALARTFVFEKPKPDDQKLIQAEIDKILAAQLPDGKLSDDKDHALQFTAERLIRLAELGCPADRAEVQKAVSVILQKKKPNQADPIGIYDTRAFCLLGIADRPNIKPLVRAGLEGCIARKEEWNSPWKGCPWTPIEHLITLWHGRAHVETEPLVAKALTWIAESINAAGGLSYKDPRGFVRLASQIDHPLARTVLEKEVPMLLRAQKADGGWGEQTSIVLRALKKHGLLEPLRQLPALPADWRVAQSIPAPESDCFSMTWDGARLWTFCRKTNEAIAVAPTDGRVERRVKLPVQGIHGIGWWDGALAATAAKAKRLLRIDPATGKIDRDISLEGKVEWVNGVEKVGDTLWVGDGFEMNAAILDPATGEKLRSLVLGGPLAVDYAATPGGVWHIDGWAPALIKSGTTQHGQLLDWGEKPFDGRCDGLAFDGTQLWALDAKNKRISVIEKTATAPKPKAGETFAEGTASDHAELTPGGDNVAHDSVQLKGRRYEIRRLTPELLTQEGSPWPESRATEVGDYGGHADPLYNLQEDVPAKHLEPVDDRYGSKDVRWDNFWGTIGRGLKGKVECLGVWACCDGKLAGKIRFFPKTLTRPRWMGWTEEEHRREWSDDVLWIGGAYVDRVGADDGLDKELVRRAIEHGRSKGAKKIQVVAGGDVRTYGMWGELFPASLYRQFGFRTVQWTPGSPDAFLHMLNGCHGPRDRELTRAAIEGGQDPDNAHVCCVMELDLQAEPEEELDKAKPPAVVGCTLLHQAAQEGLVETAQWLLEKGASVNAKDAKGRTPLDHAKTVEMEALLHKHNAKRGAGRAQSASTARFERSGKMAVIRGLEKMDWGGSFWARQDSFMACFTEVLRCAGHDVTYAEVIGLSGAAFKLTTGDDNWCPSQAICDVGADCPNQALRAFGYSREIIDLNEEKNPGGTEKARKAIVESIDRGLPVMYMDGERSLVVGYRDGGKTFICMPYAGNKDGYKEMPKLRGMIGDAWFVEVLRRDGKTMGRRDAFWESLRTAVRLARDPSLAEGTKNGLTAYETWIRKLKNPPEKANLHGHAYVTSILLTSRRAAADYVRLVAKEVKPEVAKHLRAAAQRYESVAKRLWTNRGLMKHPWDKSWTPENRGKEAQMTLQNLTDERVAIAEIEKAFAAEGVKLTATAAGPAAGQRAVASLKREGSRAWIDGVDRYRYFDPMFEGVRIILAHRGERYSPEYIQGLSGSAFRIGGICPCAPTCDVAMNAVQLIELLGHEHEYLKLEGKGEQLRTQTQKAVARVKQEVDAGRPALVWHAFSNAEWDVVYGYDSKKRQFLGRGSWQGNDKPYAVADEGRTSTCGKICPPQGVILIGRKVRAFDARQAELAALKEAVRHGRSQRNVDQLGGEKWAMLQGIACYDRWIRDFGDPKKKREMGDSYCYGVYHSVRAAAAPFLREIAPKYPKAAEHLGVAAKHFETEVESLKKGEKLLWWNAPAGPDPKRNKRAVAILQKARDAYAAGIAELGKALAAEGIEARDAMGEAAAPAPSDREALPDRVRSAMNGGDWSQPHHTEIAMLYALCRANGVSHVAYETLLDASGLPDKTPGASAMAAPMVMTLKDASAAFGVKLDVHKPKSLDDAFAFMKASIDAGQGVIVDLGAAHILCGYEDAGDASARRVLGVTSRPPKARWLTWNQLDKEWWLGQRQRALFRFAGVGAKASGGKNSMTRNTSPKVLLDNVLDDFNALIGKYGHHSIDVGGIEYVQPYVYLSFHLLEMHAAGWKDMDFDSLAAVSGASALFAYQPKEFMPKYCHVMIAPHTRIAEATGFGYEWVKFADAEGAWKIVKESVDAGKPCKGWDWENILFAGYRDAAKPADRRVFAMADGPATIAKWLTWKEFGEWVDRMKKWKQTELGRHAKRVKAKPQKDVALRVIKDLVEWSVEPPAQCKKRFAKATFGLAGMEAYSIDCADVKKHEAWGVCHGENPQMHVRRSSGVYLERVAKAKVFPKKVNERLLAAAKAYKAAYAAWTEHYKLLGHGATKEQHRDSKRRAAGAATARKAAKHEGVALESLRQVLAAEGIELASETGTAPAPVLLDGAIKLAQETGKRTSEAYHQTRCFVTARSICLSAAGADNADYETLQTVSGFGTAFAYHPKHAWVTYRPPQGWETAQKRITQATGRQWESLPPAKSPEAAWNLVKETIDSGRALMGYHFMGEHVFLGYQDVTEKEDRKVFFAYPFEYQGEWWPWDKFVEWASGKNNAFGRVSKKVRSPSARNLAVDVMKGIVRAATDDGRRERKEIPPDVEFGLAGIEAFAADVADTSIKPDDFDGGWLGCHAVYPQISGRRSAAVYLRTVAAEFPKATRGHLLAAAKSYEAAFAAWQEWGQHLGPDDSRKTLAQLKKAWRVKKKRGAAAAAIRRALQHERVAIGDVKEAMASLTQ